MYLIIVGVAFLCCYFLWRRRDPRLLRNGVFLAAAGVFGTIGVLAALAKFSPLARFLLELLAVAVPVSILVFGVALIANGVTMLRKEGRSLGNQLSLLAGVLVFVLPTGAVFVTLHFGFVGFSVAALLGLMSAYASAAFVSFALYSIVYGRMRHALRPAAIVIHGAGLRSDGGVTPLLRGRLDRALKAYRSEMVRGNRPYLMPSGGQGSDEIRPEAVAMAEYLRMQGVPVDDIIPEDKSTTTRENIEYSAALLRDRGCDGPVLLVTSDYHVLRTASLARRLGSNAQVVGARTARYYVPSAFLREFIALLVEHKLVTIIALGPFVALVAAIVVGGVANTLL